MANKCSRQMIDYARRRHAALWPILVGFALLRCSSAHAIAPPFVSDEELARSTAIAVAKWEKAPLVPHHLVEGNECTEAGGPHRDCRHARDQGTAEAGKTQNPLKIGKCSPLRPHPSHQVPRPRRDPAAIARCLPQAMTIEPPPGRLARIRGILGPRFLHPLAHLPKHLSSRGRRRRLHPQDSLHQRNNDSQVRMELTRIRLLHQAAPPREVGMKRGVRRQQDAPTHARATPAMIGHACRARPFRRCCRFPKTIRPR